MIDLTELKASYHSPVTKMLKKFEELSPTSLEKKHHLEIINKLQELQNLLRL